VTILVLSSQLENSLFLVKIQVINKNNPHDISECTSLPIKVVSKVSQLQAKPKKRTRTRSTPTKDQFISAMDKLDQCQEQHSKLLATLLEQSKQQTLLLQQIFQDDVSIKLESPIQDSISFEEPCKKRKIDSSSNNLSFENEFEMAFINLFENFESFSEDNIFSIRQ